MKFSFKKIVGIFIVAHSFFFAFSEEIYVLTFLNENQVRSALDDIRSMTESQKESEIRHGFSGLYHRDGTYKGARVIEGTLNVIALLKNGENYTLNAFRSVGWRLGDMRLNNGIITSTRMHEIITELDEQDAAREAKHFQEKAEFDRRVAESLRREYGPQVGLFYRMVDDKLFMNRGIPITFSEDGKRDSILYIYRFLYNILLGKHFVENSTVQISNGPGMSVELPLLEIDAEGPNILLAMLNNCYMGSGQQTPVKVSGRWFMNKYIGIMARSVVKEGDLEALNQLLELPATAREKEFEKNPDDVLKRTEQLFEEKKIALLQKYFCSEGKEPFLIQEIEEVKRAMEKVEAERNILWNTYVKVKAKKGEDGSRAIQDIPSSSSGFVTHKKVIGAACLTLGLGAAYGIYKADQSGLIDVNAIGRETLDTTRAFASSAASSISFLTREVSTSLAKKMSEFWSTRGAEMMNNAIGNVTNRLERLKFW